MRRALLLATFSLGVLAACAPSPVEGDSTSTAPVVADLHALRHEQNVVFCDAVFRCCQPDEIKTTTVAEDAPGCVRALDETIDDAIATTKKNLDVGLLVFDRAAAASCIVESRRNVASCTAEIERQARPPSCARALVGTSLEGALCHPEYHACAPGLWCDAPTLGASGTCRALAVEGDACGNGDAAREACPAERGLACDPTGHCAPLGGNGAACARDAQCRSSFCEAGFCRSRLVAESVCAE